MYHDSESASRRLRELGYKLSARTLARLRCQGQGPIFEKFGPWVR
jgi:hypothetical protein